VAHEAGDLNDIRAVLGNDIAIEAYRDGKLPFPEGATVGRLPENTIYIPDERLSREHARIEFQDGTFFLNDLGSRNGTALNGSLVSSPQALHGGDTIELGSNTLIVGLEAGVASSTEE